MQTTGIGSTKRWIGRRVWERGLCCCCCCWLLLLLAATLRDEVSANLRCSFCDGRRFMWRCPARCAALQTDLAALLAVLLMLLAASVAQVPDTAWASGVAAVLPFAPFLFDSRL